ncbi:hypothetical protein [Candidatus Venteria ishoeyi]|nr:hypothetical protein [Candidatus Venteria ishoeyi]
MPAPKFSLNLLPGAGQGFICLQASWKMVCNTLDTEPLPVSRHLSDHNSALLGQNSARTTKTVVVVPVVWCVVVASRNAQPICFIVPGPAAQHTAVFSDHCPMFSLTE